MKKIFAIALALMLVMSMGTTAFAADLDYVGDETKIYSDSANIDVWAKYSADTSGVSVISVDIEHEAMKFVYVNDNSKGTWNPDDHTFTGDTVSKGWVAVGGNNEDGNLIKVTNHSNVIVWIDVAGEAVNPITMKFTNAADSSNWAVTTLDAGVENKYDDADYVEILAMLEGDITADTLTGTADDNGFVDAGDITVTIYGDDPAATTTP